MRFCASDAHLWLERLRSLEMKNAKPGEVKEHFEAALGAPLGAPLVAADETPQDEPPPHHLSSGSPHLTLLLGYSHYQRRRAAAAPSPLDAALLASVRP